MPRAGRLARLLTPGPAGSGSSGDCKRTRTPNPQLPTPKVDAVWLGIGSWKLEVGSWELGVGSLRLERGQCPGESGRKFAGAPDEVPFEAANAHLTEHTHALRPPHVRA